MKQLKGILDRNNDSKKFIGLTATPVRYLDNERNMTEEIFDGNVASTISLASAMLDGLLPVPIYVNSKIACREELEKARIRVNRLAPTKEKQELEEKLNKIDKDINNGDKDINKMLKKYIDKKDGKYLIFCNKKDSLEKAYNDVDKWFEGFGKIKKYKVYSSQPMGENSKEILKRGKSEDINQANLNCFNDDKDGISILLSVDILNEGVHASGVDGELLFRKTSSPIIYFQQIGRSLSFSGRNKQIIIFDLVNNFRQHKAIDAVYEELLDEAKKRIKTNPENAERYQSIIDKFKILDETKSIYDEIDSIKDQVTDEKIIDSKLNYSIKILQDTIEDYKKKGKTINIGYLLQNSDAQKAYFTIDKYSDYVDNNQFKQLLDLNILLPVELSTSYEERLDQLDGYNSIWEREKADNLISINKYIDFIGNNGRKPRFNSDDVDEKSICEKYLKNVYEINDEQKVKLKGYLDKYNIEYAPWDKVILGKQIEEKDIEKVIEMSNSYLEKNIKLPSYLKDTISRINYNGEVEYEERLFSILNKTDEIEEEQRKQEIQKRIENLSNIVNRLESYKDLSNEELKETGIIDEIMGLRFSDRQYIRKKFSAIKKDQYNELINRNEDTDMIKFCRSLKKLDNSQIENYCSNIENDQEMYATLNGVIEFMSNNNEKEHTEKTRKTSKYFLNIKICYGKIITYKKEKIISNDVPVAYAINTIGILDYNFYKNENYDENINKLY